MIHMSAYVRRNCIQRGEIKTFTNKIIFCLCCFSPSILTHVPYVLSVEFWKWKAAKCRLLPSKKIRKISFIFFNEALQYSTKTTLYIKLTISCICHIVVAILLSAHGNPRSDPLPGHNWKPSIIKNKAWSLIFTVCFILLWQWIRHWKHRGICLNRHNYFTQNGKVEQESLSDKLNSLNCSLKHSVGLSPPVLSSIEGCNCRSFIHHCQQTVS